MPENKNYTSEQKQEMLTLARNTINFKLAGKAYELSEVPPYLNEIRSCFVTLHTNSGNLRGCIGNIIAFETLYENITHNALNSAFGDPRFPALSDKNELDSLNIEISVLTPPSRCNSYNDIILGKHGIILSNSGHSAVFLPQVAVEQNWDIATTLTHLCMKAGLPGNAWQDSFTKFDVFEAIVFKE